MGIAELLFYATYIGGAFALSVAAVLGFGLFLQTERSLGRWIVPVLIPLITLGISLGALLSKRNLTYASFSIESINVGGEEAGGGWLLRIISFTLVGLCGAKIVGQLLQKKPRTTQDGSSLFIAFVAFFVANAVLNSAFGSHPAFIHNSLYAIALFAAVYLARHEPLDRTIHFAKLALLGLMVLSLVAAAVKPEIAIQPSYKGWIPGLSIRLWGLGSNPNSIGPLALLLLLLEAMQPFGNRWLHWGTFLVTLVVFTLAQSKTVWLAALVCVLIVVWYRYGKSAKGGISLAAALGLVMLLLICTVGLAFVDPDRLWQKITFTQAGNDISTLTGRSQIWLAAVEVWRADPFFGYGPTGWGPEHRIQLGLPFAFTAHNQFLQSLSVAGGLGAVTLVAYVAILGAGAVRAAQWTRGISLALFANIIVRSVTEAPLAFGTILNGDFLTHLMLFAIALRRSDELKPSADTLPNRAFPNTKPVLQ